ncbi:MAG: class I SAM-dependent methyltransferase [Candidatus Scalindua sp.]|jgi:2-polyprenyl-3-methyl-5-hydroxy-6-metoxy-1,4-benzoquinol methylase|nr:class I SAM-dependent methyltransferase [Candidatus Scalindua sp.]MBT5306694.1 class I SAM-dependent methyltransferase [Candidatus Scalindua sp.]MBT6051832.1 class I SAM-dependent methyltransferase [Candidatus Scalindua sp.]MBT6226850.1 class I SAM-dependent methyltransferase [Candidatus Scalindua sp.]MBT7211255.1 class I SAM-dependent methyltransferase [Candidatus Scalindua sp.]
MSFDCKNHWENVYDQKKPVEVSWYQVEPTVSLEFIASTGIDYTAKIIDVGGGASALVDKLLDQGFQDLTVLDISSKAMHYAQERLGRRAENVRWVEADVTAFESSDQYDVWHDRAVFHFLTDAEDRAKYMRRLEAALKPGGHIVISAFAINGPPKCSDLEIKRYSPEKIKTEFGDSFELVNSAREVHITPWNKEQKFIYCYFKKIVK